MAPNQSNLSDPKYLYDFVVSTTQESINSGLSKKFLDEIMYMSGGLNPFDIPHVTDWGDERIQKLTKIRLLCAIRMRTDIPTGCVVKVPNKGPQLKLLEAIITLEKPPENVHFSMYCSEISIIKNNVPGGSAFSLHQLLVNLKSAVAQTVPTFEGVTDIAATYLLGKSFIALWSKIAKDQGLPLIGVSAVAQKPDGSPLRLTALERWVSPVFYPLSGERI
ncbi:uncharacterized protein FTOL_08981 [Fusarium torulosum]|uniref:Uncharacterized protein n=1 Tax=Fusarium torulosum TaxID=33205 RepID=A0AAE8SKL4_9HYPO|nr:uncharacterized protein FTOL_08981 [Fusarium torulosum]